MATELSVSFYAETGGSTTPIDTTATTLPSNWTPLVSSDDDPDTIFFASDTGSAITALVPVRLSTTSEIKAPAMYISTKGLSDPTQILRVPNYSKEGPASRLTLAVKFTGPEACIADRPRLEAWDSIEDLLNGVEPSNMILTGNKNNGFKSYLRAFDTTPYVLDPSRGLAPAPEWWRAATVSDDENNNKCLSGRSSYLRSQLDVQPLGSHSSGDLTTDILYFSIACAIPASALLADEQNEFVLAIRVYLV